MTENDLHKAWFEWARNPGRYDSPCAFALEMVRRAKNEDVEIVWEKSEGDMLLAKYLIEKSKP